MASHGYLWSIHYIISLIVLFKKFGITVKFVNSDKPEDIGKAIDENTKAVYVESIGNPKYNVAPIPEIAQVNLSNVAWAILTQTLRSRMLIVSLSSWITHLVPLVNSSSLTIEGPVNNSQQAISFAPSNMVRILWVCYICPCHEQLTRSFQFTVPLNGSEGMDKPSAVSSSIRESLTGPVADSPRLPSLLKVIMGSSSARRLDRWPSPSSCVSRSCAIWVHV